MKNKMASLLLITVLAFSVLSQSLAEPIANQEKVQNKNQIKIQNQEQNKAAIKAQKAQDKLAEKIRLQQKTKTQLKQMDKLQLKDGTGTGEKVRTKTREGNYQGRSTK